jgi:hypothetical protein
VDGCRNGNTSLTFERQLDDLEVGQRKGRENRVPAIFVSAG